MHSRLLAFSILAQAYLGLSASLPRAADVSMTAAPRELITQPEWTRKEVVLYREPQSQSSLATLDPQINPPTTSLYVVLGLITQNGALAAAVCAATGGGGCIAAAIAATIASYALLYVRLTPADTPPASGSSAKRTIEGVSGYIHSQFEGSEHGSTLDALRSAASGEWLEYGNITVHGVDHTMHFNKKGNVVGVRAVRQGGKTKRDDDDDEQGMVATYFWEDNDQTLWTEDVHGYDLHPLAKEISDYAISQKGDIMCADIITGTDADIDTGVMTLDDGNNELGLIPSQWDSAMAICKKGEK